MACVRRSFAFNSSHNLLVRGSNPCLGSNQLARLCISALQNSDLPLLFRLDDDHRIEMTVTVIFGGKVGRIGQPYTIDQKPIGVFAGR